MHILWQSDYMMPTGFSQQAEYIINALSKAGHHIDVIAWQHRGKVMELDNGVRIFSSQHAKFGRDQYPHKLKQLNPDLVITLSDLWQVRYMCNIPREAPWIALTPVDTTPLPPQFYDICSWIDQVVSYSRFGMQVLEENEIGNIYIPHGVDLELFKPPTEAQKKQYKRMLGFPEDAFIIGFCGRINPRKQLDRTIRIFELLTYKYPDRKLMLFLHSDLEDSIGKEHSDLRRLIDLLGLHEKVKHTRINWNEGVPLDQLRFFYGVMDLYLTTTSAEGFGVPLIEAQACGIPCIATNFTTPPELLEGHGELIEVERFVTVNDVKRARCSIQDGVKKVSKLIEDEELREEYSKKSIEFVKENYDITKIQQAWINLVSTFDHDIQDAQIEELIPFEETLAVQQLKKEILARVHAKE